MTNAPFALSPIGREALDDPAADPALVTRMVADLARCNRWLGGASAVHYGLSRLLLASDRGRSLTLLDVGTGAGDLPRDAVRWAARRNITLRPIGLERISAAARVAKDDAHVPMILGCAGALPLRARSVDFVMISQVAHHLSAASAARLFADADRLARRGVIVADLHRTPLASLGFRVAARLLGVHPTTLHDGVTSLKRGYTVAAMAAICEHAGITNATVKMRPFARVVAWWTPSPPHQAT